MSPASRPAVAGLGALYISIYIYTYIHIYIYVLEVSGFTVGFRGDWILTCLFEDVRVAIGSTALWTTLHGNIVRDRVLE